MISRRVLRHGVRISRIEVVRNWRRLTRDRIRTALLVCGGLFAALYLGLMALVVQSQTADLVAQGEPPVPPAVGMFATISWLSTTAIFAQRAAVRTIDIENPSLLLTSTRPAAVTVGILGAEFVRGLTFVCPLVGVLGIGFYAGVGAPAPLVTIPLAVCLCLGSSVPCGYAVGAGIAVFSRRSRGKTPLIAGGITLLGAVGVVVAIAQLGTAPELAARLPTSWYGDIFAVGTPIAASPARVVGAVLGTIATIGLCGPLVGQFATMLWFDDGGSVDERDRHPEGRTTARTRRSLEPFGQQGSWLDGPVRWISRRSIQRTKRNPARVTHLGLPLVVGALLVFDLARTDAARSLLPVAVALLGAWFVGGVLTLNPLGDEGAALPATLTAPITGTQFVRGTALVTTIGGIPLLVAGVSAVGVISYPLAIAIGFGIWAGVHGSAAVGIALAVGMWFPRFGAIRVGQRREAVPPSLTAVVIYSMAVLSLGTIGVVALVGPQLLFDGGIGATLLQAVTAFVWLVLEGGIGYGCYRAAVRRFERYTIE